MADDSETGEYASPPCFRLRTGPCLLYRDLAGCFTMANADILAIA